MNRSCVLASSKSLDSKDSTLNISTNFMMNDDDVIFFSEFFLLFFKISSRLATGRSGWVKFVLTEVSISSQQARIYSVDWFKGHLISACLFDFFKFSKKPTKNLTFCPRTKRCWNHQNIDNFLYNIIYIWLYGLLNVLLCLYFMVWPLFRFWGRNLSNFLFVFWKI